VGDIFLAKEKIVPTSPSSFEYDGTEHAPWIDTMKHPYCKRFGRVGNADRYQLWGLRPISVLLRDLYLQGEVSGAPSKQ
jgi:hypothetical protein